MSISQFSKEIWHWFSCIITPGPITHYTVLAAITVLHSLFHPSDLEMIILKFIINHIIQSVLHQKLSICSLLPRAEVYQASKTQSTGMPCWLISPGRKINMNNPKHSQTSFVFGQKFIKKPQTVQHPIAALLEPFWQGLPHPNSFSPILLCPPLQMKQVTLLNWLF